MNMENDYMWILIMIWYLERNDAIWSVYDITNINKINN